MAVEEPATTTAAPLTEQLTTTVEVTVRITNNASGTLFEAVPEQLQRIPEITAVTVTEHVTIAPRNGATHVTVAAEVTATNVTTQTDVVAALDDAVCVEDVEATSVT